LPEPEIHNFPKPHKIKLCMDFFGTLALGEATLDPTRQSSGFDFSLSSRLDAILNAHLIPLSVGASLLKTRVSVHDKKPKPLIYKKGK